MTEIERILNDATATRYVIMTTNAVIKSSFYLKLLMTPPLDVCIRFAVLSRSYFWRVALLSVSYLTNEIKKF